MKRIAYIAILVLLAGSAAADEDATKDAPTTFRELVDQAIADSQVFPSSEAGEPAQALVTLRWANNTRGSDDGATVLYLHEGRPIAAACVFPLNGYVMHEFDAIVPGVIARRKDGATPLWTPTTTEVKYADVPGAEPPEASPAARLRQLKSLAEQFEATMTGWNESANIREELRLLPRALHRLDAKQSSAKLLDSAVFAFVTGTDPEAFLLLQAAAGDAGEARWQYALVRRTSAGLEARHDGKIVWTAERNPENRTARGPHFTSWTPIDSEVLAAVKAVESK